MAPYDSSQNYVESDSVAYYFDYSNSAFTTDFQEEPDFACSHEKYELTDSSGGDDADPENSSAEYADIERLSVDSDSDTETPWTKKAQCWTHVTFSVDVESSADQLWSSSSKGVKTLSNRYNSVFTITMTTTVSPVQGMQMNSTSYYRSRGRHVMTSYAEEEENLSKQHCHIVVDCSKD
ncbi:hypothetical protein F2P81_023415 [Scophthalmus maximus]|uniref:Uncharacterized protein n=1 Tax=Scophthalmus maximus TaxID=52904 RepID=A0A6A4RRG3_SCOMX|nr:hypothetical protein F2P81_023415 [Scophthalmus maximus]